MSNQEKKITERSGYKPNSQGYKPNEKPNLDKLPEGGTGKNSDNKKD
jgi:hypothetical protein